MRRSRWNRFLSLGLAAIFLLLIAANLPFYSGSTIGATLSWRLEHGRLRIDRRAQQNPEPFYIAFNTERLLWMPDYHYYGPRSWFVKVPMWMPAAVCGSWAVWAWWPRKRVRGGCRKCGYSLAGLAAGGPCPECGSRAGARG